MRVAVASSNPRSFATTRSLPGLWRDGHLRCVRGHLCCPPGKEQSNHDVLSSNAEEKTHRNRNPCLEVDRHRRHRASSTRICLIGAGSSVRHRRTRREIMSAVAMCVDMPSDGLMISNGSLTPPPEPPSGRLVPLRRRLRFQHCRADRTASAADLETTGSIFPVERTRGQRDRSSAHGQERRPHARGQPTSVAAATAAAHPNPADRALTILVHVGVESSAPALSGVGLHHLAFESLPRSQGWTATQPVPAVTNDGEQRGCEGASVSAWSSSDCIVRAERDLG